MNDHSKPHLNVLDDYCYLIECKWIGFAACFFLGGRLKHVTFLAHLFKDQWSGLEEGTIFWKRFVSSCDQKVDSCSEDFRLPNFE